MKRITELSVEEYTSIYQAAQMITQKFEEKYGMKRFKVALQDGPQAGQSVPHVHMHIVPVAPILPEEERKDRTEEVREKEAEEFRTLFNHLA